jgi:predicted amidohydrolase YtcJ
LLILYNGNIRTSAGAGSSVSALAIQSGRVSAAGTNDQVLSLAGKGDQKQDLHGKTIWPGLVDAHIHLDHYARSLNFIDCELAERANVLRRVADRARLAQAGEWIRGHGWNQNLWPDGFGARQELDAAAPNHPVYLTAKSLHASWANSAALQQAGIDSSTPDPHGGQILHGPDGSPTGILLESAMNLVEQVIPRPNPAQLSQLIARAQSNLWKVGLTGVHDFDGPACFQALQLLQEHGQLKLRVVKSIPVDFLDMAVRLGLHSGFGNEFLRFGGVKCFSDGALGPRTAAMIDPYEGEPQLRGSLLMSEDDVLEIGRLAGQAGLSLAIHAIGDLANRTMLNGYARLRAFEQDSGRPALRHRMEHVQILHPADFNRLADLNIIASVQPIHATSDRLMADRHWGSRSTGAYPYRTLLESGAAVVFGSDAPVEPPNPFLGLHAAVTRRRADGSPGPDGWIPAQRVSLAQALAAYTLGPAFAAGLEDQTGRLEPGCLADLIVLQSDPFNDSPDLLHTICPLATMVGGEWVWQSN